MRRFFNFLAGVVVGGLVGSALILLFTPDSGKNLRLQITKAAADIEEEVRMASQEKRIELEKQLETFRAPRSKE